MSCQLWPRLHPSFVLFREYAGLPITQELRAIVIPCLLYCCLARTFLRDLLHHPKKNAPRAELTPTPLPQPAFSSSHTITCAPSLGVLLLPPFFFLPCELQPGLTLTCLPLLAALVCELQLPSADLQTPCGCTQCTRRCALSRTAISRLMRYCLHLCSRPLPSTRLLHLLLQLGLQLASLLLCFLLHLLQQCSTTLQH